MKQLLYYSVVAALALVVFTGCRRDDTAETAGDTNAVPSTNAPATP